MSAVAFDNKNVFAQDTHRLHKLFTYNPKTEISLNTKWNRIWKVAETAGSVAIVAFGLLAIHFTAVHYAVTTIATLGVTLLGIVLFVALSYKTGAKSKAYAAQAKLASQILEKMNNKRDDTYWNSLQKKLGLSSNELWSIKKPEESSGELGIIAKPDENRLSLLARYDLLNDLEADLKKQIAAQNVKKTEKIEPLKKHPINSPQYQRVFKEFLSSCLTLEKLNENIATCRLKQAFLLKLMIDCDGKTSYSDYFSQSKIDFVRRFAGNYLPQAQDFLVTPEGKRFTVEDIHNTPIRTLAEKIFELPIPKKKGFFG
ncbi:MAG: hypothetical protein K1000chlam2_00151 [Chlamydiae bacterium]|nr:hypothetical protein [Chlamydiota bacterium]